MPDALEARRRRSEAAFYRLFDGVAFDGAWAAVTPSLPERSLFNAVVYEDPAALIAVRDEVEALYASRGVRAWTVWVNTEDRSLADALASGGHVLDATPESMGAWLRDLDLDGDDLGEPLGWDDVIAINEAAYRMPAGAMAGPPLEGLHVLGVPGEAVVASYEVDGDCWMGLVATHPSAQGRGLCPALMKQALRAARDRGCESTSLEASKAGEPVYAKLGYRRLGRLEMWEKRLPHAL